MKLDDFIAALYEHGWDGIHDAQGTKIKELHAKLWPELSAVERELDDLVREIYEKGIEL